MKMTRTLVALALLSGLAVAQQPSGQDPTGHGQSPRPAATSSAGNASRDRKTDLTPAATSVKEQFGVDKSKAFHVAHRPVRDPFTRKK
ncbi:MAG: hypothetical protein U0931_14450 [Vulcanimicrobiota bacterium]